MNDITVDQVLSEFARLSTRKPESDGGMTSIEMRKALGIGGTKVLALVKEAIAAGKLVCRRSPRLNVMGDMQRVPVYFPVKKPAKKVP